MTRDEIEKKAVQWAEGRWPTPPMANVILNNESAVSWFQGYLAGRDDALEEAARQAEDWGLSKNGELISKDIRALKGEK